ncbi:MAG: diguanylate cyclase [Azospirillum sp.]|nr:diguanylate cyclase [Azospirillum sp.]
MSIAEPPSPNWSENVLHVLENRPGLAEHLASRLIYCRYRISGFPDVAALLEANRREPPSAVIVELSAENGRWSAGEVLGALNRGAGAALPTIVVSDLPVLRTHLEAVQAGARGFLVKPIDAYEALECLERVMIQEAVSPYRVMIVDDDACATSMFTAVLRKGGMVTRAVNDPLLIMESLNEFQPDLLLLDIQMPGCNGIDLAVAIRQIPAFDSLPILYLSSMDGEAAQFAAMARAGDGFLSKKIKPAMMISAVAARAERMRILRQQFVRDPMTRLLNHTAFKERLVHEVARARRQGAALTLGLIDIDNFKRINDHYGHPVGDVVIKTLGHVLRQRFRRTDGIGRYGGEEFGLILPGTEVAMAKALVDDLRCDFARVPHRGIATEFAVTFSCGLAEYRSYPDAVQLVHAADVALYQAKRAGRNRVLIADEANRPIPV